MISDDILHEMLRVLREKFKLPEDRIEQLRKYVEGCTERVEVKSRLRVITEDPDDDRILECAVASGSDTIVTGDKDLLRQDEYQRIRIVRVGEFLTQSTGGGIQR